MFDTALAEYKAIDSGYDSAFGHYADSVKETIQPALDKSVQPFAHGRGNQFFTCTWAGQAAEPCPVDTWPRYSDSWDLYFDLKDRSGYFSELNNTYGVIEDWVEFGKYSEFIDRSCPSSPCFPSLRFQYIHGYPLSVADPKVPNPKEVLLQSIPNMNSLRQSLVDTRRAIIDGSWDGPVDDVVEVLSMPVFMLIQAVDSMRKIKDIGEKAAAEEKKNLIITIISAILFFLPFAGQAAIAGNLINLGRMIIMIAAAGEVALSIQDIVQNPTLAPLLILDLLSKGKLKTSGDFGVQAANRRALSPSDLTKLGPVYKMYEDNFRNTVLTCAI